MKLSPRRRSQSATAGMYMQSVGYIAEYKMEAY